MTFFFVSKCWPNYYSTNFSELKYNFEFLCHIRGENIPDCTRHHFICSRFFFSFLLQCFRNIVPTFNNLILHSTFYRFRHHPYVLGKLYLLLFLFHGKRYKIANLHICRLLLLLHDFVKNSINKSEITQLIPNHHILIKNSRFHSPSLHLLEIPSFRSYYNVLR